jgi:cytochrome c peroxidase
MKHPWHSLVLATALMVVMTGCRRPDGPDEPDTPGGHNPTPYALEIPPHFPPMPIPADNPLTVEGVQLGRHLFYEKRLSGDNSMSCASCHLQPFAMSDPNRFSTGIDGIQGTRNAMALINLGWDQRFFWDGRAQSLEQQVFFPVRDPIEMHETWPNAVAKLQADPAYRSLFSKAFGTTTIDSVLVSKAIAQFMRTMISGNSKFDRFMRGEEQLSVEEQLGFELTLLEGGTPPAVPFGQGGADCFHCHPHGGGRFTDGIIRNNGLDPPSAWTDLGLGGITGLPQDYAKFKTPTLRNVALTAPYMHDGRFQTLEEVIEHYNSGGHASPTTDPNMKFTTGGLYLTPEKKAQLIAFLHTLTDMEFVNDPKFSDPGPPQP